jgi:hypothetical protein
MAIQRAEADSSKGQKLYDVMVARLRQLGSSDQITLGFAIQKGAKWPALSRPVREAFDELAEDLQL